MRNSLGVRGARVYVLFVFVRSFGLLTALAGAPLLAWLLGYLVCHAIVHVDAVLFCLLFVFT